MKTTYTVEFFGDTYSLTADFAQASCPIEGDEHGRQVADFRHSPRAAMESLLREMVQMGGDDPDESSDEIDAALDAMTERTVELIEIAEMLEGHGSRFSGNSADDEAQNWLDNDFTVAAAGGWCEIGCWDADTAATFRAAGLTPDEVSDAAEKLIASEQAEWDAIDEAAAEDDSDWTPCNRDSQYTNNDPIYSVCNNDTSADEIIAAAKE